MEWKIILVFGLILLGGLGIGALLIINGHLWTGVLAMLLVSGISIKGTGGDNN
jgi:hypothetical protein